MGRIRKDTETTRTPTRVGRLGGLAAALGIGAAVTTGISCGAASADTTGQSGASAGTSASSTTQSSDKAPTTSGAPQSSASEADDRGTPGPPATSNADDSRLSSSDEKAADDEERVGAGAPDRASTEPEKDENPRETSPAARQSNTRQPGRDDSSVGANPGKPISHDVEPPSANSVTTDGAGTGPHESTDIAEDVVAEATPARPSASSSTVTVVVDDTVAVASAPTAAATAIPFSTTGSVSADTGISVVTLQHSADPEPSSPASAPAVWTIAAAARRELSSMEPTVDSTVVQSAMTQLTTEPQTFTGQPSLLASVESTVLRVITTFTNPIGLDLATLAQPIASDRPPFWTTLGLRVERDEFDGMPVWTLTPPSPSGKYVAAIHGGAYVVEPTVIHWLDYAAVARSTGATVVVPIYTLAPESTASVEVPRMADFLTALIDRHGAQSVSVYADSAGGGLALAAAQELVRRGSATPASMVLLSPWLDVSMTNPAINAMADPLLYPPALKRQGALWAGDLALTDPMVSPVYGSLDGLPPVFVYSGNLDSLSPDVLVLQEKALATPGSQFTFVLRDGQIHDWALPLLPDGLSVRRQILHQLTGTSGWPLAGLLPLL